MTDRLRGLPDDVKNRIRSIPRRTLTAYLALDMPETAQDLSSLTPSQYSQLIDQIIEYDTNTLRWESETDRTQLEDIETILLFLARNSRQ